MRIASPAPGFEKRGFAVVVAGVFHPPRLLLDGTMLVKEKGKYFVVDNAGAAVDVKLSAGWLDPVPRLTVAGRNIPLAPPLRWYQWAWAAFPMIMVFEGGLIGGAIGYVAARANAGVFRSERSAAFKYALAAANNACAVAAFIAVAVGIRLLYEWSSPGVGR
jgi:hypothetical protein